MRTTFRSGTRLVRSAFLALLILSPIPTHSVAQSSRSLVGIVVRYGWAPTNGLDDALGVGLELEAFPGGAFVPVVRADQWNFGIDCVGLGACVSSVTTISLGGKYRLTGAPSMVPYAGGDIGYMEWTSDLSGASVRLRVGADIRLMPHIDLNIDGAFTRFIEVSDSSQRMLEEQLTGLSAGLRLWL